MAFYRRKMFGEDEDSGANWIELAIAGLGLGTAIAGAVGGQPTTPTGTVYNPGVQPQYMAPKPAIATSTILLLGGAAVAVLFLMKK